MDMESLSSASIPTNLTYSTRKYSPMQKIEQIQKFHNQLDHSSPQKPRKVYSVIAKNKDKKVYKDISQIDHEQSHPLPSMDGDFNPQNLYQIR